MKRVELLSLEKLISKRLGSVTFVMNYLQLMIDDSRLNVMTNPIIREVGKTEKIFPSNEFKIALIDLIPHEVTAVRFENNEISLEFGPDTLLMLPLVGAYPGNEAIVFQSLTDQGEWWVLHQEEMNNDQGQKDRGG